MTRLSADEAVNLIENAELNELGAMALARKRELHPQGVTTFIVDRNINYTNACWVDCKFCAFYRDHKDEDAYVLGFDEIGRKIEELIAIGGTQILFQGGVHPKLKIEWYYRRRVHQYFLDSDFKCNTIVPAVGTDSRIKHLAFRSQVFFLAGGSTHLEPCVSPDH